MALNIKIKTKLKILKVCVYRLSVHLKMLKAHGHKPPPYIYEEEFSLSHFCAVLNKIKNTLIMQHHFSYFKPIQA